MAFLALSVILRVLPAVVAEPVPTSLLPFIRRTRIAVFIDGLVFTARSTVPKGGRIPLDAHIRLANPRTPKTDDQRIVRRSYNDDRGFDQAGTLDQGIVFVAFNQDPERQFAAIQRRL